MEARDLPRRAVCRSVVSGISLVLRCRSPFSASR